MEDVGPKGRRDLNNYRRAEILNYLNKHTMKETLVKYPEVSESRTCIQSLCCLWTSPFYLYRN